MITCMENGAYTFRQDNGYNGLGQRTSKFVESVGVSLYTAYDYQMGSVVHTSGYTNRDALNLLGDAGNIIASERNIDEGKEYYFYNKDIRSSTTTILDRSGTCENSYEYGDFGETTVHGDLYNEICYTGGIYDETTGLYYLNARYYNPADKRFLTEDTYRGSENDPNTLHLYAYCANNPVNYVDPSGHFAEAIPIGYNIYKVARGAAVVGAFVTSPTGVVLVITALICVTVYQGVKYYKVKAKNANEAKSSSKKGTRKKKQTKKSNKEKANDVPTWVKNYKQNAGENGTKFADRVCNDRYGKNNYRKGPGTEYNQIKKWGDRRVK